ncbi:MAG: hypothetical protein ACKOYG_04755, partial [Ilumatobacteraceae bacterium]
MSDGTTSQPTGSSRRSAAPQSGSEVPSAPVVPGSPTTADGSTGTRRPSGSRQRAAADARPT